MYILIATWKSWLDILEQFWLTTRRERLLSTVFLISIWYKWHFKTIKLLRMYMRIKSLTENLKSTLIQMNDWKLLQPNVFFCTTWIFFFLYWFFLLLLHLYQVCQCIIFVLIFKMHLFTSCLQKWNYCLFLSTRWFGSKFLYYQVQSLYLYSCLYIRIITGRECSRLHIMHDQQIWYGYKWI